MTNIPLVYEFDNYQLWQLDRYGNILPSVQSTPEFDLFESGIEELNRIAEWIDMQAQLQEVEHEDN